MAILHGKQGLLCDKIAKYPQFVLYRYQQVGQKPSHSDTPEKCIHVTDALISLFKYFVVNYIFECYRNPYLSQTTVLHKLRYMVFKIPY